MKKRWAQWTTGGLLVLALFFTGCAEKKIKETTSQAPSEQGPSALQGESRPSEGTGATAPGNEQDPAGASKEEKPAREKKQRLS